MTEFKVVVESFQSNLKSISEAIQSLQTQVKDGFHSVQEQLGSVREQIALLHEGQTEIKSSLKQKVDREEFVGLEKRVSRLETKVA